MSWSPKRRRSSTQRQRNRTDHRHRHIRHRVRDLRLARLPAKGKRPAIRGGRGLLDATTDIAQIAEWWGGQYRRANIGGRVPEGMVVIDIDPYHGGLDSLAALEKKYEPLPTTLTDLSGRGDGGAHYFFRRPPGQLTGRRLGVGIDVKTSGGYVVLAPSAHPDTGRRYRRIEAPVAAPPRWLSAFCRLRVKTALAYMGGRPEAGNTLAIP